MLSYGALSELALSSLPPETFDVSASVSGAGSQTGTATARRLAAGSVTAFGTSSATGYGLLNAETIVFGLASTTASSIRVQYPIASASGVATVAASPVNIQLSTATVSGAGTTTSVANAIRPVTTNISGTATSAPAGGSFVGNPTPTVNGVATTAATGRSVQPISATVQADAQITGNGLRVADGNSTVNGIAITSVLTILIQGAFGNLLGSASAYSSVSAFNYFNLRDSYDTKRIVYVERQTSSTERTVRVSADVRSFTIERKQTTFDRTVRVAA